MSRHDPFTTLRQMLACSQEAVALVANRTREALDEDRLLNLALVRLLEIIECTLLTVTGYSPLIGRAMTPCPSGRVVLPG